MVPLIDKIAVGPALDRAGRKSDGNKVGRFSLEVGPFEADLVESREGCAEKFILGLESWAADGCAVAPSTTSLGLEDGSRALSIVGVVVGPAVGFLVG